MRYKTALIILAVAFTAITSVQAQTAKEVVRKANDLIRAGSSVSTVRMKVVKPDWSREMSMKVWSLEPDYSLVLITSPAKDKGMVTLKRKNEVWNWIPRVQRIIKIPPSMMLQSWMGSDFTNDDLVRESSIVEDYNQKFIGDETFEGYDCHKIELIPKPDAGVVWGKIIMLVSKKGYLWLRSQYFDEDGALIKTMTGSHVQKMGGRTIPVYWEMVPENKPGEKTIFEYKSIEFNVSVKQSFFSQRNMKRVR